MPGARLSGVVDSDATGMPNPSIILVTIDCHGFTHHDIILKTDSESDREFLLSALGRDWCAHAVQ
jgi:DUF917 family protein